MCPTTPAGLTVDALVNSSSWSSRSNGVVGCQHRSFGQFQAQGIAGGENFTASAGARQLRAPTFLVCALGGGRWSDRERGGVLTSVISGARCKMNACDIYPSLIISGLICQAGTK